MKNNRTTAYIELIIVSMIWGAASPIIKFTLGSLPPDIFLTYRFFLSTITALILYSVRQPKFTKNPGLATQIIIYSFLNSTVGLGFLFLGFDLSTALMASLISAVSPILVTIAGALLLRDHVTKIERIGISIAFIGTLFTILEPLFNGHYVFGTLLGNILVLISVLVGVITSLWTKTLLRDGVEPSELTHLSFIIGFLTMLPIVFLNHSFADVMTTIMHAPAIAHLGVLYMALISGTFAYTLANKGQKTIEVSEAALFTYLLPLWATPLSVIWLGEKITTPFAIGMVTIAIGVGIAEYKKHRNTPHHAVIKAKRKHRHR